MEIKDSDMHKHFGISKMKQNVLQQAKFPWKHCASCAWMWNNISKYNVLDNNQSAIMLTKNMVFDGKTKNTEVLIHFICDCAEKHHHIVESAYDI